MNDTINADLIKAMELESLPLEKQREIIERSGAMIFGLLMEKCIQILPEEKLEDLEKIMSDPENSDGVYAYLKENIEDFDSIVEKVVADFKGDAMKVLESI